MIYSKHDRNVLCAGLVLHTDPMLTGRFISANVTNNIKFSLS